MFYLDIDKDSIRIFNEDGDFLGTTVGDFYEFGGNEGWDEIFKEISDDCFN